MKWTIAFLVGLGILASVCIVLLVNALRVDSSIRAGRGEIQVVLAKKDLPPMSMLTSDMIELGKMKSKEAPAGFYSGSTQVIGKIAAKQILKGQVLTQDCFISESNAAQVIANLPPGMRAFGVTLSSQSVSGGLLYPGCVVDVLASFQLNRGVRDEESKGEAISTTLLHAVQVLAIAGDSMVSKPELADKAEKETRSASRNLTVTLLVDPKQAEALQLAMDNGKISLAMRNPLDKSPVNPEATVLSRGKLSRLGSLLGATVKASAAENGDGDHTAQADSIINPLEAFSESHDTSHWEVTVIRGSKVVEQEVKDEK